MCTEERLTKVVHEIKVMSKNCLSGPKKGRFRRLEMKEEEACNGKASNKLHRTGSERD